jgi:hypothetical protein
MLLAALLGCSQAPLHMEYRHDRPLAVGSRSSVRFRYARHGDFRDSLPKSNTDYQFEAWAVPDGIVSVKPSINHVTYEAQAPGQALIAIRSKYYPETYWAVVEVAEIAQYRTEIFEEPAALLVSGQRYSGHIDGLDAAGRALWVQALTPPPLGEGVELRERSRQGASHRIDIAASPGVALPGLDVRVVDRPDDIVLEPRMYSTNPHPWWSIVPVFRVGDERLGIRPSLSRVDNKTPGTCAAEPHFGHVRAHSVGAGGLCELVVTAVLGKNEYEAKLAFQTHGSSALP